MTLFLSGEEDQDINERVQLISVSEGENLIVIVNENASWNHA